MTILQSENNFMKWEQFLVEFFISELVWCGKKIVFQKSSTNENKKISLAGSFCTQKFVEKNNIFVRS